MSRTNGRFCLGGHAGALLLAALGDGAFVREATEAVVQVLKRFAAPTGTRGSVLFMQGGLIILGFLFLTFLFRSAIVGDLAPVANGRAPVPRVLLPGRTPPPDPRRARQHAPSFDDGRREGRAAGRTLDEALDALRADGLDLRILESDGQRKRVRLYRCASCSEGLSSCERERGLLAGCFEGVTGELAKVEEALCAREGAPYCEFEIRHGPRVRVAL